MNHGRGGILLAILALGLTGFFVFPGRTYLQQDTQIWVPMLEHLWDSRVLERDLLATRPHLAYTIYDEVTLALRYLLGVGLDYTLPAQQLLFRLLGIYGVWLLAVAAGLSPRLALLPAATYSLGATIAGPAVLTLEYEPTPRAFAGPLLMLSLGLAAGGKWLGSGVACGLAVLYHPPTAVPVLFVYGLLAVWPGRREPWPGLLRLWAPILSSFLLLYLSSLVQAGIREPQVFFEVIDAELEQLQRFRGSYNWVSMWRGTLWLHYAFLAAVAVAALLRLGNRLRPRPRLLLAGLALYGLASPALSYLLLETLKWALAPQMQPARAIAFVVLVASFTATVAAVEAAKARRWIEAAAWLIVVYAIPAQAEVLPLLLPDLRDTVLARRWLTVLLCAGLAVWAVRESEALRRLRATPVLAASLLAPMLLMPSLGAVANYPDLHQPDLYALAHWARHNTPEDAMFLFVGFGKSLDSGIFRARALRAIYVDWKGGGQVNLLKQFALEWWRRWTSTLEHEFSPGDLPHYYLLGIDYVVVRPDKRIPGRPPVYENGSYLVYKTGQ
jgi:hypothetical protein